MEKRPRIDWRRPLLEKVELAGNRNRNKAAASVCVEDDAACRHYWKGAAGVAKRWQNREAKESHRSKRDLVGLRAVGWRLQQT